ncbi:MAG: hypothetical protein FD153_1439 [Rhodospirillaceae bacterium]|nr:MAG: hypothetical protein FD153_1439 [Rhodospirillaceae bacterium]
MSYAHGKEVAHRMAQKPEAAEAARRCLGEVTIKAHRYQSVSGIRNRTPRNGD